MGFRFSAIASRKKAGLIEEKTYFISIITFYSIHKS